LRAAAAGVASAALAVSLAACGGESSSNSSEASATYPVKVVTAAFPAGQRLGQTSLMRIGVRNSGRRTVPALTVTVSIAGRAGQTASLPFAIHDPEPGLAQPDRPVWVLAQHYPKLAGSSISAGAEGSARKTFDFGPLRPGTTTEAVWKLSAVKAGRFTVLFTVGAGLGGKARAVTTGGAEPGGSFATRISQAPPNVVVTDSGRVVTIPQKPAR
jgi:ABC-type Fe3+-hydroxamate transport system substrate-binding protein